MNANERNRLSDQSEAVENACFEPARRWERVAAAQRLIAMNAPVADRPQMEAEIVEGALQNPKSKIQN